MRRLHFTDFCTVLYGCFGCPCTRDNDASHVSQRCAKLEVSGSFSLHHEGARRSEVPCLRSPAKHCVVAFALSAERRSIACEQDELSLIVGREYRAYPVPFRCKPGVHTARPATRLIKGATRRGMFRILEFRTFQ